MRPIMIAVRIQYDGEPLEEINISKNRSSFHAILRIPNGESVPKQILTLPVDFIMDL